MGRRKISCTLCRKKRLACDGSTKGCHRCLKAGVLCHRAPPTREETVEYREQRARNKGLSDIRLVTRNLRSKPPLRQSGTSRQQPIDVEAHSDNNSEESSLTDIDELEADLASSERETNGATSTQTTPGDRTPILTLTENAPESSLRSTLPMSRKHSNSSSAQHTDSPRSTVAHRKRTAIKANVKPDSEEG